MNTRGKKSQKVSFGETHLKHSKIKIVSHSWPSRFLSILLCMLLMKAITTTAQNSAKTPVVVIKPPPLSLSQHDVTIQVGQSSDILLMPSISFVPAFENLTSSNVSLVFHTSQPGVIGPLEDVLLVGNVGNGTVGPIAQNHTIGIVGVKAGLVTVTSELVPDINVYKPTNVFVRVDVYKYETLTIISTIVGWIYFAAWSVSFYPQIIQNYQRKSVRGLSLDFVFLNITGFAVYAIFNVGLYCVKSLQQEYFVEYPQGVIPVQLNDVIFTLHALFASGLTLFQCLIYDRGAQTLSDSGKMLLCTFMVFIFIIFTVATSQAITWLTFLTWCSYVKLVITLIKYMPQAYLNWYRKSTSGWSIGNVLLDFTGGVFSLLQMTLISFNYNDWSSFFGDLTKFGLGLVSILFDIFFIVQHYILYRNHAAYEPIEGGNASVDTNQYGEITTSNHHFVSSVDTNREGGTNDGKGALITSYKEPPTSSASARLEDDDVITAFVQPSTSAESPAASSDSE